MFLSVIIPVYNEEQRLPSAVAAVGDFLAAQPYTSEIIVVENGSTDNTVLVGLEALQRVSGVSAKTQIKTQLIQSARGKGAAVKTGMLSARGKWRFMCDCDLSMPITELPRLLAETKLAYDIVIASRAANVGGKRIGEPQGRHLSGLVFNALTRALTPHISDTQCGFKLFSETAARRLFPRQTITGWAFDVEILYLAQQAGYSVAEVGVEWHYNGDSRVRVVHDGVHMAQDVMRIWVRGKRGVYARPMVVNV